MIGLPLYDWSSVLWLVLLRLFFLCMIGLPLYPVDHHSSFYSSLRPSSCSAFVLVFIILCASSSSWFAVEGAILSMLCPCIPSCIRFFQLVVFLYHLQSSQDGVFNFLPLQEQVVMSDLLYPNSIKVSFKKIAHRVLVSLEDAEEYCLSRLNCFCWYINVSDINAVSRGGRPL